MRERESTEISLKLSTTCVPNNLFWVLNAGTPDLGEPVLEGGGQLLLAVVPAGVHRSNNPGSKYYKQFCLYSFSFPLAKENITHYLFSYSAIYLRIEKGLSGAETQRQI